MNALLLVSTDDASAWFNMQNWVSDSRLAMDLKAQIVGRGEVELLAKTDDWEDADEIENAIFEDLSDYGVMPHIIEFL